MNKIWSWLKKYWKWIIGIVSIIGIIIGLLTLIVNFLTWQFPKNYNTSVTPSVSNTSSTINIKKITFEGDVFNLIDQIGKFPTKLDQESEYNKYIGLIVSSTGYITNIFPKQSDLEQHYYYNVVINKDTSSDQVFPPTIFCKLDDSWQIKINSIVVPYRTNFNGRIIGPYESDFIFLDNCELY